jgi:hypothetical protein
LTKENINKGNYNKGNLSKRTEALAEQGDARKYRSKQRKYGQNKTNALEAEEIQSKQRECDQKESNALKAEKIQSKPRERDLNESNTVRKSKRYASVGSLVSYGAFAPSVSPPSLFSVSSSF